MKNNNYFIERDQKNIIKLRELLSILPYFCREYFVGIEMKTSTLTRINYANDLKIFFIYLLVHVPYFKNKELESISLEDLEKITSTDIEYFLSYLSNYELDGKTYSNKENGKARKLSTIRSLFNFFYKKDKLSKNITTKVSIPKIHEKDIIRLDNNEINDLISTIENTNLNSEFQNSYNEKTKLRDLAIIYLLLGTGIRASECVGLNMDDIDQKNNAFVVTRKGGNQVRLYFSNEIKEKLQDYIDYRMQIDIDNPALFLSLQNKRLSIRALEYLVKKYAKIISPLKKISPHKFRSTYGTNLYRETKDIYVVAEVLGHKDINTTKKHYAAISEDIKKNASTKITIKKDKD